MTKTKGDSVSWAICIYMDCEKEKTQITEIRNEVGTILHTTDSIEIKIIKVLWYCILTIWLTWVDKFLVIGNFWLWVYLYLVRSSGTPGLGNPGLTSLVRSTLTELTLAILRLFQNIEEGITNSSYFIPWEKYRL